MIHQWFCGGADPCACMESWKGLTDEGRAETMASLAGDMDRVALGDLRHDIAAAMADTLRLQERLHPVYCKRLNMVAAWLHQAQAVTERIGQDLEGVL